MGGQSHTSAKTFEAALRLIGEPRLRLDQILRAYQDVFPHEAMQPDMRKRLHDALVELSEAGVLSVPEGCVESFQNQELPTEIEMNADANFFGELSSTIN